MKKYKENIVIGLLVALLLAGCNDLASDKESSNSSSGGSGSSSNPTREVSGTFIPEPEKVTGIVPLENPIFPVYPDLEQETLDILTTRDGYAFEYGDFFPKIAYAIQGKGYLYMYDSKKDFLSEYYVYIVIKDVVKHKIKIYIHSFKPDGKLRFQANLTNVKTIGDYYYYAVFKGDIESASYVTYTLDSGTPVKIDNLSKNSNKLIEL